MINKNENINECKEIKKLYDKLIDSKFHFFPRKGNGIKVSSKQGIYIIYNLNNIVLHVGRTVKGKNGLNQRLNNHKYRNSSFAKNYLKTKKIDLINECKFQFIIVEEDRIRTLLEHYTIGKLCPKHLGTGKTN